MVKFFLDSSFIIELLKNNKIAKDINNCLIDARNILLVYNHIVLSELVYQLYFKRKYNWQIIEEILKEFDLLELNKEIGSLSLEYIYKYNLKPNDALILATCKHYGIKYLISLDEDFKKPCKEEGIVLIDSVEKLKEVLDK
jgi:predicted nucleic acid-binding protein